MEITNLVETTVAALGYELIECERVNHARLLRVFVDKNGGITVDDCARVSNQLTRVFAVEGVDYDRLEVSSPGMDRLLKRVKDFKRYQGEKARVRVRVPINGQRNFVGVLRDADDDKLQIEVDGAVVSIDMASVEKARLVPEF